MTTKTTTFLILKDEFNNQRQKLHKMLISDIEKAYLQYQMRVQGNWFQRFSADASAIAVLQRFLTGLKTSQSKLFDPADLSCLMLILNSYSIATPASYQATKTLRNSKRWNYLANNFEKLGAIPPKQVSTALGRLYQNFFDFKPKIPKESAIEASQPTSAVPTLT